MNVSMVGFSINNKFKFTTLFQKNIITETNTTIFTGIQTG